MSEITNDNLKAIPSDNPGDYLVVEDREKKTTWHLQVKEDGTPNHRLMGAAWAALHSGFRGNVYEGPQKQEAIAKLKRLYASEDLPLPNEKSVYVKSITDETAIVAGYGVIFGGNDLEGENFQKDTDFMLDLVPNKPVLYDHALQTIKSSIGTIIKTTIDDVGLFIEAQIEIHKKYVKEVLKLIDEGIIGWSSGSVGHLIEREGKSIKRWPIVEFSLTPTPAEPRTLGVERLKAIALDNPELKALIPQGAGEAPEGAAMDLGGTNPTFRKTMENIKMTDITLTQDEYKDLLKAQVMASVKTDVEATPPAPPEDPAVKSLSDKLDALVNELKTKKVLKDAGYIAPDSEEDHAESKSFGDFLIAIQNGNVNRIKSVYKTALAEDAGATGGYLVPTQMLAPIMAAAEPFSVLRRAGATIVPMGAKGAEVPVLDIETAPSAGDTAYAAGVVAYWTEEAATLTESEPRFRLVELVNHKLAGYTLASNEVREDASASLDALLSQMFGRAVGSKENYAFFRGDGVGKPLGIMSSNARIAATRSAASAFALADVSQMLSDFLPSSWNTGAWFMNPELIDQLVSAIITAPVSWIPDARAAVTNLRLAGMPIYFTGALPSLNTVGDVLLVDPKYYLIGDRQALSIAYSEHYKFANDQGTWRFTHRVDGQPWVDNTITLENATTVVSPFVSLAGG